MCFNTATAPQEGPQPPNAARQTESCRADLMTVSGQFSYPPPGNFMTVSGQFAVSAVNLKVQRSPTDDLRLAQHHVVAGFWAFNGRDRLSSVGAHAACVVSPIRRLP